MDEYKKAIFNRYEKIKSDAHSDLLEKPTPAKLKDLCQRLFDALSEDDKKIYIRFFKIDSLEYSKIKEFDNDKFRPIVRFLKGGVPPINQISIELIAILVGQDPRPFQKFRKLALADETQPNDWPLQKDGMDDSAEEPADIDYTADYENVLLQEEPITYGANILEEDRLEGEEIADDPGVSNIDDELNSEKVEVIPQKYFITSSGEKRKQVNRLVLLLLGIASITVMLFVFKNILFEEGGCMVWKGDHYETVACDIQDNAFAGNSVVPLNKDLLMYQKKLTVSDTTTFFNADGTPCVWYGKTPGKDIEYFSYPGRHPETKKELTKISHYMVSKYIMSPGEKH